MWDVELTSPLPPDECAARIRDRIDAGGGRPLFAGRPVVGSVTGRSARLRRRLEYLNSFQTALEGSFDPQGGGSVSRGEMRFAPAAAVRLGCFLAAGTVFAVVAFPFALIAALSDKMPAPLLLVFAAIPGVPWVAYRLARADKAYLTEFVAAAVDANSHGDATPRP